MARYKDRKISASYIRTGLTLHKEKLPDRDDPELIIRETNPFLASIEETRSYAERHQKSVSSVEQLCRQQKLPARNIGGNWIIYRPFNELLTYNVVFDNLMSIDEYVNYIDKPAGLIRRMCEDGLLVAAQGSKGNWIIVKDQPFPDLDINIPLYMAFYERKSIPLSSVVIVPQALLALPIAKVEFTPNKEVNSRMINALWRDRIQTVEELLQQKVDYLCKLRNFGERSQEALFHYLNKHHHFELQVNLCEA